MDYVKLIEAIVRIVMRNNPAHGYEHVMRVRKLALQIASRVPNADKEVVELAALLHDIGRNLYTPENHATRSAMIARELLTALGYPKEKLQRVVNAIEAHSYSGGAEPNCIEGEILSDADKLDALGAVGLARVFMYSGQTGRGLKDSIAHIKSKLLKLPNLMKTEEGKKLAQERVKLVKEFLKHLETELNSLNLAN